MPKVVIQNLAGSGITTDPREPSTTKAAYVQNFDVLAYQNALRPFTGMVASQTQAFFITDFQYVMGGSGIGNNILGYGVISGQGSTGHPELYMRSGDLITSGWTTALASPGGASRSRGINNNLFFLYKGYVYYGVGGTHISRIGDLEASGTAATLSETYFALNFTTLTQAIRHSKDDIMYFGADNTVYYKNGAAGTITLALTLPSNLTVTAVEEDGNFLAIACKPTSGIGESTVFLWDRDTSLTTVSESIPWGTGLLKVLGYIEGEMIGVSLIGSTVFNISPRIVIKSYMGGQPQVIAQFISENSTIVLDGKQWKSNNILYFGAQLTLNGASRNCIFAVGKGKDGNIIVVPDVNVNNDTALTGNIDGFAKFDDIWYVAFNGDGSLNRTIADGTYAGTSVYESLINPSMPLADRDSNKELKVVGLKYAKLPANAQAVLKYRVNGATSWTIIQTDSVQNSILMFNVSESDGTPFTSGRDFEFRIESTNGAKPVELFYIYEVIEEPING